MKLFYQWISPHYRPPMWMMFAVYRASRNQALFAVPPLYFLIECAWWLQDRWARAANAPSWIEREVEDRIEQRRKYGYL
jgi:hypothetical protein